MGLENIGDEPYNFFLTVIYPSKQLKILEFNRLLKSLNDMTEEEFLEKLSESFNIEEIYEKNHKPSSSGHIGLFIKDKWYDLVLKNELPASSDPVEKLDYQILSDKVFKIVDIHDVSRDKRVEFVKGTMGTDYLVDRCHKDCKAAFVMHPVSIEEVCTVANANKTMPPKSTCFSPKPCSGLFVNIFDNSEYL